MIQTTTPYVKTPAAAALEYDSGFCDGIDGIELPDGAGQAYTEGWLEGRRLNDASPALNCVESAALEVRVLFDPDETWRRLALADAQMQADYRDDREAQRAPF